MKSFGPELPPSKFLRDTLATDDIIDKDPIYMKKHIKTRDVFKASQIEGARPARQARNPRLRKNNDYINYNDVIEDKPRFQKQQPYNPLTPKYKVYAGTAGKVIEYGPVPGSSPKNLTRHRKNLSNKDNLSGI